MPLGRGFCEENGVKPVGSCFYGGSNIFPNGNVLFKDNKVLTSQSELYHANGATAGYDSLNQLAAFSRGTLSDANSDGIPDTISMISLIPVRAWVFLDPEGIAAGSRVLSEVRATPLAEGLGKDHFF